MHFLYHIPKQVIRGIFADGDVLTNLQVTRAYTKLSENLDECPIFLRPPENVLDASGGLNLSKASPDDWIQEDYTAELVFKEVQTLDIHTIDTQLTQQINRYT